MIWGICSFSEDPVMSQLPNNMHLFLAQPMMTTVRYYVPLWSQTQFIYPNHFLLSLESPLFKGFKPCVKTPHLAWGDNRDNQHRACQCGLLTDAAFPSLCGPAQPLAAHLCFTMSLISHFGSTMHCHGNWMHAQRIINKGPFSNKYQNEDSRKEKRFVSLCSFLFPRIPTQGFMKTLWFCPSYWLPPKCSRASPETDGSIWLVKSCFACSMSALLSFVQLLWTLDSRGMVPTPLG